MAETWDSVLNKGPNENVGLDGMPVPLPQVNMRGPRPTTTNPKTVDSNEGGGGVVGTPAPVNTTLSPLPIPIAPTLPESAPGAVFNQPQPFDGAAEQFDGAASQSGFRATQEMGPSPYISPEATVSGQLTKLLDPTSDYQKTIAAQSNLEAQRKGLLASTMAIEAGRTAAIKGALPIAQQDASLYGQSALRDQDLANQSVLKSQDLSNQSVLNTQDMTAEERLSAQQATQTSALQRQAARDNMTALGYQGDVQLQMESFSQQATDRRFAMEQDINVQLANTELSSQERSQYMKESASLGNQLSADLSAILRNPDYAQPDDMARAMDQVKSLYKNNMDFLSSSINVELDWTAFDISTSDLDKEQRVRIEEIRVNQGEAAAAAALAEAEKEKETRDNVKWGVDPMTAAQEELGLDTINDITGIDSPIDIVSGWF